jgi:hypothetical protein
MLDPIDPVFERDLQATLVRIKGFIRTAGELATKNERERIRLLVEKFEDYDNRGSAVLVDEILGAIGE